MLFSTWYNKSGGPESISSTIYLLRYFYGMQVELIMSNAIKTISIISNYLLLWMATLKTRLCEEIRSDQQQGYSNLEPLQVVTSFISRMVFLLMKSCSEHSSQCFWCHSNEARVKKLKISSPTVLQKTIFLKIEAKDIVQQLLPPFMHKLWSQNLKRRSS